ncbi:MAG: pyridoxal-phosphate-dependent aminotransferase family protein [Candidatus Binatia bacterium]
MSRPLVGHLDPVFLALLDEVQGYLRELFGTGNEFTLPISATGSAGMEACFANLVEDGDEVVIGVNGIFGGRMAEVARRLGARVIRAEAPWGEPVSMDAFAAAMARCRKPALLCVVHAETSTGVWQPLEGLAELAHGAGALLLVDAVTSLGGCPLQLDVLEIDACYSGSQKCLSCPPGLSPLSIGGRAMDKVRSRKTEPRSWYLDFRLIGDYFGSGRVYHHTAPISMIYALAEALAIVREEGLEARFERHRSNHMALLAGLAELGLEPAALEGYRLWMLNSITVPGKVDEAAIRTRLLHRHGIEIGAGLGPLAGKVWRIGLMGESSKRGNVERVVSALAAELGCGRGQQALEAVAASYGRG